MKAFEDDLHRAEEAAAFLSNDEQRLLEYVRSRESSPVGYCNRRVDEMAADLGISQRKVQDITKALREAGKLHRGPYEKGRGLRPGQFLSEKPFTTERIRELTGRVLLDRKADA